jgi:hypothetical protein
MLATTAVYPERAVIREANHLRVEGLPCTFACTGGPQHARSWRDGVESTIGPAGLNLRRLEGVSESSRSEEERGEPSAAVPERSRGDPHPARRNPDGSAAQSKDPRKGKGYQHFC